MASDRNTYPRTGIKSTRNLAILIDHSHSRGYFEKRTVQKVKADGFQGPDFEIVSCAVLANFSLMMGLWSYPENKGN